jgi:hypothetical protein
MPTPTYDQLVKFRDVYVTTWNSGDKEGFLDNFRQFLGGEGDEFMTMTDPVGTPPRFGLNGCVGDPFDMWQPVTRFHVPDETFCVCGNEICWIMENHFDDDGRDIYRISIENFRFHEDGTIHIRTWFQMPEPDSDVARVIGRILAEYLPDGGPNR